MNLAEEIHIEAARPQRNRFGRRSVGAAPGIERRLADSLEVASRAGSQVIKVEILPGQRCSTAEELIFSQKFACVDCGIALPEITPSLFSFNSPEGACPACNGLGIESRPRRAARTQR